MAKILGFELKAVKSFKDHDGYPIYQGNVYFKNKKLGFWSQDAWGGPDQFDFDVMPYNKAMKEMDLVEMLNLETPYGFTLEPDMDILMGELLRLKEDEKMYKKFAKQGYPKTMRFVCSPHACFAGVTEAEAENPSKIIAEIAQNMNVEESALETTVLDADSFTVGETLAVA